MPDVFTIPDLTADLAGSLSAGMSSVAEPLPPGSVAPGDYTVRITDIVPGRTERGGKWLNIGTEILGPTEELVGAPLVSHFNLNSPGNFEQFKRQLRRMGIQSNDGEEILTALQELVGSIWAVSVRHNNGYQNVYLNRRIRGEQ